MQVKIIITDFQGGEHVVELPKYPTKAACHYTGLSLIAPAEDGAVGSGEAVVAMRTLRLAAEAGEQAIRDAGLNDAQMNGNEINGVGFKLTSGSPIWQYDDYKLKEMNDKIAALKKEVKAREKQLQNLVADEVILPDTGEKLKKATITGYRAGNVNITVPKE